MTSNTQHLADTLSRHITHRRTSPQDLVLLRRLLNCVQWRCRVQGWTVGVVVATTVHFTVVVLLS